MNFHPFKLKIINQETGHLIKKIEEFKKSKQIISLLYFDCLFMEKSFTIGDLYYNEEKNVYYIFSLLKCSESGYTTGINGFGFIELSFVNDNEDIFFTDFYYKDKKNNNFKKELNNCIFKGNLFLMKEDKVINNNFCPYIYIGNYEEIVRALSSENLKLNLGLDDRAFSLQEMRKKLPLNQKYLDRLINGKFSIRLYEKTKNSIIESLFTITSYTGTIYKLKDEKKNNYLDYLGFYDNNRASILSYQQKYNVKIGFNEFIEAIDFYKETISILTEHGISFVNHQGEDSIPHYMKYLVKPNHYNYFEEIEEDYESEDYINNLLQIIS